MYYDCKLTESTLYVDKIVYRYYHQFDKFHNLLRMISNEVVHRAHAMVGEDVLREPLEVGTCDVIGL